MMKSIAIILAAALLPSGSNAATLKSSSAMGRDYKAPTCKGNRIKIENRDHDEYMYIGGPEYDANNKYLLTWNGYTSPWTTDESYCFVFDGIFLKSCKYNIYIKSSDKWYHNDGQRRYMFGDKSG